MTKVINLFGGPCVGKSTLAADLFSKMKRAQYRIELVTEFAKELVWENRIPALRDQVFVLGMQNRMIGRLIGKVDFVITDSPILMNIAYRPENYPSSFDKFVVDLHNVYDNINIFMRRSGVDYSDIGRVETLEEAIKKDNEIITLLKTYETHNFLTMDIIDNPVDDLMNVIVNYEKI